MTGYVYGDRKNERFRDSCILEHDRFGGPSVLVWGGISYDGSTDLYIIQNDALTGDRYRDEILHEFVRPYAGAVGEDFVLMDDNARPHRAHVVTEYLEREGIERMDWPARSADNNPIEIVYDILHTDQCATCPTTHSGGPDTSTHCGADKNPSSCNPKVRFAASNPDVGLLLTLKVVTRGTDVTYCLTLNFLCHCF